jgi:hypothetical protein
MTVPGLKWRKIPISLGRLRSSSYLMGNFSQARRLKFRNNQAAARLWQAVHFFEVGGATPVRVLTISS